MPAAQIHRRTLVAYSQCVTDDFVRADSTTSPGPGWTAISSVWGISTNRMYLVSASPGPAYYGVLKDTGMADGTFGFDITGMDASTFTALVIRATDTNNMVIASFYNGNCGIYSRVAGVETAVATGSYTVGTSLRRVEVVASGSAVALKVAGTTLISGTLSAPAQAALGANTKAGVAGVLSLSAGTTRYYTAFSACP